jgi:hypothetical protein
MTQEFSFSIDDRTEIVDALKEIMLTPIGQEYKANYYVGERADDDLAKILRAAQLITGRDRITVNAMLKGLELLIDSGQLAPKEGFVPTPELSEPEPDTRPRDRNGELLGPQQIAWSEYRAYAESHTSDECRQRARSDSGFASFMSKNLQREMAGGVGDAVTPIGTPTSRVAPTQELSDFARKYQVEPSQNLRPKGGFVTLARVQQVHRPDEPIHSLRFDLRRNQ